MILGIKVSKSDLHQMINITREAVEFALWSEDLSGEWIPGLPEVPRIAVHAPEKFANGTLIDLSSPNESIRQSSIRIVTKSINVAEKLGKHNGCDPVIILHPGGIHPGEQQLPSELLINSISQLPHGKLLLENMPHYYWYNNHTWNSCIFTQTREITRILDETGLGLCLDLSHAKMHCNHTGENFYEYVRVLAPYTQHIHAADTIGETGEGLQVGTGEIDFKRTFELIGRKDIMVVPEIKDGHQNKGGEFRIAIERLGQILRETNTF